MYDSFFKKKRPITYSMQKQGRTAKVSVHLFIIVVG